MKPENESKLVETRKYRCLIYHQKQTEDIYLRLCGVENCVPDFRVCVNDRPGYHLHVILSGKGTIQVNGQKEELHAGQMFMTKPGEDTVYQADQNDPWCYCWMTFDGNLAKSYADSAGFCEGINWLYCNVDQQRFYSLVKRVLDRPLLTLANDLMRLGTLLEFIGLAVESSYYSGQSELHRHEYTMDYYVQYAIDFINVNYASVKIADVARCIGIHRSYLTSLFKSKMGISPQEYLMQCRFKHSKNLLLETKLPIQDISRSVGYHNPLTFSKMFKHFYGISPSEYRMQNSALGQEGEPEQNSSNDDTVKENNP